MHHKLQNFPPKNDVQNSVVRNDNSKPQSEIASNGAGLERADNRVPGQDYVSGADSRTTDSLESGVAQPPSAVSASLPPTRESGRPEPCEAKAEPRLLEHPRTQPRAGSPAGAVVAAAGVKAAAVPQGLPETPRCEVARSAGYDPTGENAVACGAPAETICEYCGPMCSSCSEETFCFYGEHKLHLLDESAPPRSRPRRRRQISEVVYVEIKCPNCRRVRLALPKKHRPKARRKCPVCKTEAPAEYLAHGFTRRRLPYHEVFSTEKELPEGIEFKRRMPWDARPPWWVEED